MAQAGNREDNCPSDVEAERIIASSKALDDGSYHSEFVVPSMHCAGCIGKIERGLAELEMVERARVNLSAKRVSVTWNPTKGSPVELEATLDNLGFEHHLFDGNHSTGKVIDAKGRQLLLSLAVAGFAAANIMLLSVSIWSGAEAETTDLFHLISALIAVPAVAFAGRPFFSSALKALSARRLNMDVPISLAVIMALGMGIFESLTGGKEAYFDAAVTLLFFLLIGRYLDHLMREKARGAVEQLARLSSKGAIVVGPGGETRFVAVDEIERGMRLRVLPGERFPVDGRILTGETELDRSLVTGETASVYCGPGIKVESGVLNLTGMVEMEALGTVSESFLAEVMRMMDAAENGRSRFTRIADRMASIYAPVVHALALIAFIGWIIYTGGDWHTSIYTAIAVLIITCPCALGLAVPVAHVVSAARLFKDGIMLRDGHALERLATATTVMFDKTGTLTSGEPRVASVNGNLSGSERSVAALASASSHPNAKAIDRHLNASPASGVSQVREVPGYGVEAKLDGKICRLGRAEWVAEIASGQAEPSSPNSTSVTFAISNQPAVTFELSDDLRAEAVDAVEKLRTDGFDLEILSGDQPGPVAAVAAALGIEKFNAGLDPKAKIRRLEDCQAAGEKVLFVGDGLNDAPALVAGHVSMAPATASDVGRMASDLVFTRPSLMAVPNAIRIARKTHAIVLQNFAIAIAYNCIAVPLAMAGQVTPLIAAVAMSSSSIAVVANSLRINLSGGEKSVRKDPVSTTVVPMERMA